MGVAYIYMYKIMSHQHYLGLFLSSNMRAVVADMDPDEVQEQILRQLQQMNQRFEALREDVETLKGFMHMIDYYHTNYYDHVMRGMTGGI